MLFRGFPSISYVALILFYVAFMTERILNAMPQVLFHSTSSVGSCWSVVVSDLETISYIRGSRLQRV